MNRFRRPLLLSLILLGASGVGSFVAPAAHAATATQDSTFNLQITPSPLVTKVTPGDPTSVDVQVRNNGTATENLKVQLRTFKYDKSSGNVTIDDTVTPDIAQWVTIAKPTFSVEAGQVFTEKLDYNFPKESAFSYYFVVLISRADTPAVTGSGRVLQGTIADFALVNIDRPDAKSALSVDENSLKTSSGIYEYLPATFNFTIKNTGNTILQPTGNIFVQRTSDSSAKPLATLDVNSNSSYILPGTSRVLSAQWDDGYPKYVSTTQGDGSTKQSLDWSSNITHLRIGEYTAKAVLIYNNGTYEVPLNAQTTFWVIPWKILLGLLVAVLLIAFAIFTIIRGAVRRARGSGQQSGFRR